MKKPDYSKPVHGGDVWTAAQRWGMDLDEILDFSANINPLGPSPLALQAIVENIPRLTHYPEPCGESCRLALAEYLKVDEANVVLGNGGSELIYLLGRMFYKKRLVLLAPCFSEYGEGLENPHIVRIPLDAGSGFALPWPGIMEALEPGDLIFVGNPNNPTGNLFDPRQLLELAAYVRDLEGTMVVDEAFLDFTGRELSLTQEVEDNPHLIVVGSLTKFFAIPGLRLGYAVACKEHIQRIEFLLPTWRINTLAIAAGRASLADRIYIENTVSLMRQERRFLMEQLQELDFLQAFPGASNFLLINAEKSGLTAAQWAEHLRRYGILIRDCSNFANLSPYYFRIAVKNRHHNLRLIEALKRVIAGVFTY